MSWTYILQNSKTEKYYIGSTNNLNRRIQEHKACRTRTTRVFKIFELVYKEEFKDIADARRREKTLKTYKSKKYINWLIAGPVAQR